MSIYTPSNPPPGFYIYAYIRTTDSDVAKAGTPYYIGKGIGNRAWRKNKNEHIKKPKDCSAIVIMESNLTNVGALALERRYISWYGREDMGNGILRNRTHGGEGFPGPKSEKTKDAISKGLTGRTLTEEHKRNVGRASLGRIPWNKGKKAEDDPRIALYAEKQKGRSATSETRDKISKIKKGQVPWNKGKKGLQVAWNKGLTKETDERVEKYSKQLTNRNFTEEHRKNIGKSGLGRIPWNKRTIYTCDDGDYDEQ